MSRRYPINKNRKGQAPMSFAPAVVVIIILIVFVVLALIYAVYSHLKTDTDDINGQKLPDLNIETTSAQTVRTTKEIVPPEDETEPEVETEEITPIVTVDDITSEDFARDLFIGDSIATGFYLYDYIDKKNVFAKVGLHPGSVLSESIDGATLSAKIGDINPRNIYIMIGTNGVGYLTPQHMAEKVFEIVEYLLKNSPDSNIYLLSIPPVTKYREDFNTQKMDDINDYNTRLFNLANETGVVFLDVCSLLKDSSGYFDTQYAENDGLHFKGHTYKLLLNFIKDN